MLGISAEQRKQLSVLLWKALQIKTLQVRAIQKRKIA